MITVRNTLIILAVFFISACNNNKTTNGNSGSTNAKTFQSKNSDSFNLAFEKVLTNYDSMRNAFIDWDTVAADKYAAILQTSLLDVPYEQLKDETAATNANSITQNATGALEQLMKIDSIQNKRRFFYTVSEILYHLVKTTGYDKAVIYHKKCPMAFNGDKEGWWLSETKKIDNPYFGKYHPKYKNAMLECGTVEDSVNNMQ
jgi:hypothetical protein